MNNNNKLLMTSPLKQRQVFKSEHDNRVSVKYLYL